MSVNIEELKVKALCAGLDMVERAMRREPQMLQCVPDFQSDAGYHTWLDQVHQEISDEGENNADHRQEEKD
jgi:hypothetical protein